MWESLNNIAQSWWNWQWPMLWQSALLIGIVVVIDLLIRKWAWPQLRYALWLLVLVKLMLPPGLASSVSVTAPLSQAARQTISVPPPAPQPQPIKTEKKESSPVVQSAQPGMAMPPMTPVPIETAPPIQNPPLVEPTPAPIQISWHVYAMGTWLLGVLGLSLALMIRLRALRRKHQRSSNVIPDWFNHELQQAAQDLKVTRLPQVVASNRICCPAVFGLFRPVLLVPDENITTMNRTDARHILLHELAHIARGDLWVHTLHMLLLIAYWPNPLLWLMRKHLQNLRELCCDTTVARHLKEDTPAYRETLIETAKGLLAQPVDPGLGLLGLFENSSWLLTRLQWLEKKTWRYWRLRIMIVTLTVSFMLCGVLPMAVIAQQAGTSPEQGLKQALQASWQAISTQDYAAFADLCLYKDNAQREWLITASQKFFQKNHSSIEFLPIHFVTCHTTKPNHYSVTFLCPLSYGETYAPLQCTWILNNGQYKLDLGLLSYTQQAPSDDITSILLRHYHQQQLDQWQQAQGPSLSYLIKKRVQNTQDMLLAVQRAYALGAKTLDGCKSRHNDWLERLTTLSPEDAQDAVIQYHRDVLDKIDRISSPVKKSAESNGLTPELQQPQVSISPIAPSLFAAYDALFERNDIPDAISLLNLALGNLKLLKTTIKDTEAEQSVSMAIDKLNEAMKACRANNLDKAKTLMESLKKVGPDLDKIVKEQAIKRTSTTLSQTESDIKVLGICDYPNEDNQWWGPLGDPLPAGTINDPQWSTDNLILEDHQTKIIAIQIANDDLYDVGITWKLPGSDPSSHFPSYQDRKTKLYSKVQYLLATFPKSQETAPLSLGLALGEWRHAASTDGKQDGYTCDRLTDRDVHLHPARMQDGQAHISISHLIDHNYGCRIIAIDSQGDKHTPLTNSNTGAELRECQASFDLSLEDIKYFELQARPYEWIEFKNIALRPQANRGLASPSTASNAQAISIPYPGCPAVYFLNGIDDYWEISEQEDLNIQGPFTVECWVKVADVTGEDAIFSQEIPWQSGWTLIVSPTDVIVEGSMATETDSQNKCSITFAIGDGQQFHNFSTPACMSLEKWYHVAAVYNEQTVSIFIDDQAIFSQTSVPMQAAPVPLRIGKASDNLGRHFHGQLADIRLWTSARTAQQIQTHMNSPLSGHEANLLTCWATPMDSEGVIRDRSPHKHHAQAFPVLPQETSLSSDHLHNIKLVLKDWIDSTKQNRTIIRWHNGESEELTLIDPNWVISLYSVSWTDTLAWASSVPLPGSPQPDDPPYLVWHLSHNKSRDWHIDQTEIVNMDLVSDQSLSFLVDHPEASNTVDRLTLDFAEATLDRQQEQLKWILSFERMKRLSPIVAYFTDHHAMPTTIDEAINQGYLEDVTEEYQTWLSDSVVYLGHQIQDLNSQRDRWTVIPIAYDQEILTLTGRSPVLFAAGQVQPLSAEQINALQVDHSLESPNAQPFLRDTVKKEATNTLITRELMSNIGEHGPYLETFLNQVAKLKTERIENGEAYEPSEDVQKINLLLQLGIEILSYWEDHHKQLPSITQLLEKEDTLPIFDSQILDWLHQSVCYLGSRYAGQTLGMGSLARAPLAYDKDQYQRGERSLVIYLDGHLELKPALELQRQMNALKIDFPKETPNAKEAVAPRFVQQIPETLHSSIYITGDVAAPGKITISPNNPMSLTMAISSLGGIQQKASSDILAEIRRIPSSGENNTEQIIYRNLDKIYDGSETDPLLQPNDVINIKIVASQALILAQPEYEWWLKEPKQQIVIDEGDDLVIRWEIEEELHKKLTFLAVGVLPAGIDISENNRYQWLANDVPITARSSLYGKHWTPQYSLIGEPNKKASPLIPGQYRIVVFGFSQLGGESIGDWRHLLQNSLTCTAQAKLIVNANPNPSSIDQSQAIPAQIYTVRPGDNLSRIGEKYQIPYQWIAKTNKLAPDTLRAGQDLMVITGPVHAKVYRSSCKLELWANEILLETYQVGLGQEGHVTPTGLWRVAQGRKMIRPQWTDGETGRVYQGDEPDYPLGERWIGLKGIEGGAVGRTGFAIHGTHDSKSLGAYSTNGCIRMSNQDVIEVYDLLLEGVSQVKVVD